MQTPDQVEISSGRPPPGIATHYLRYAMSNAFLLFAGFVSFPILTRLLDNTQFGILKFYETWMLIGVAAIKLGVQHAIVRFYPYDGDPQGMRVFGTNLVVIPLGVSALLWALAAIALALWQWWSGAQLSVVLWCAVVITPMIAITNVIQMVVRASERSDLVVATRIVGRLLELVLMLGAVILVQRSASAVFGGKVVAALLLLAWLLHWMRRNVRFARDAIDGTRVREGFRYGLPMMVNELAGTALVGIDRLLLKEMTEDFAVVGIYAIGYALAMQINLFIAATLSEAFTPAVNRAYDSGGGVAVRALKDRVLLPMTYAVVAIVAMLVVSGHDLLVALSGPDKAASGSVFVVVGITMALFALTDIVNYGLLLKNRTMAVLMMTLAATVLNVALNLILIPRMGYMGAAWATAVSYAVLSVARFFVCPKGLARFPDARTIGVSLICAAILVTVANGSDLFGLQGAWSRLFAAGGLFVLLYALPSLVLDPRLRSTLASFRVRAQWRPSNSFRP